MHRLSPHIAPTLHRAWSFAGSCNGSHATRDYSFMKAIAVRPGQKDSVHLADLPVPSLEDIPNGRGVLVRLLRCGVDGTDKEINAAEYGAAPEGYDFLTIGLLASLILRLRGIEVTAF